MARPAPLALCLSLALLPGCAGEELLHGLSEPQANEVLVALDEAGVRAEKGREDGADAGWVVSVSPADVARAHRALAVRSLPRVRPAGFAEVFARASMVPTPTEEHALYLHALGGELSRTVEAIEGVVAARVHVGLPQPDPLRPGERPAPRAAVLVKCRPAACAAVRALEPGVRSLVAGAVDGLSSEGVSVVIAEASLPPAAPGAPPRRGSTLLVGLAGAAGLAAVAVAATGLRARRRREVTA